MLSFDLFILAAVLRMHPGAEKYKTASTVFKLSVSEYPEYAYGYYYLGKAYEKSGKVNEVIAAYREAIRKNPGSRAAIEADYGLQYLNN